MNLTIELQQQLMIVFGKVTKQTAVYVCIQMILQIFDRYTTTYFYRAKATHKYN